MDDNFELYTFYLIHQFYIFQVEYNFEFEIVVIYLDQSFEV